MTVIHCTVCELAIKGKNADEAEQHMETYKRLHRH